MDVAEDTKYAFLLGSALRNEDPEQLFVVYDNLIPEDVSKTRLEHIKEEARHISELPEPDFSKLVLNARNYSLAPGHSSMIESSGRSSAQTSDNDEVNSSLQTDIQDKSHTVDAHVDISLCKSLSLSSFHKTVFPNSPDSLKVKLDLVGVSADDDSGLPDSYYRASSSLKNSMSCSDSTCGDSEEEQPLLLHTSKGHVTISHSFNPPYDEEVKVDTGTEDSSVESPRSETSVTHDEYNLTEEGTEMATLSYKETPQPFVRERNHSDDCWDYTGVGERSDDVNMEDEEKDRDRLWRSRCSSSYVSSFPRTTPRDVDEVISYGIKQLDGAAPEHTNGRMMFTSCSPYQDQYKSEESKDKTDKESLNKDDSDKPEVSGLVDVNGNPRSLDSANNSQMHQLPRGKSEITAASGSLASYPSATIPKSSTSVADANTLDRKKERKRLKLERQKWTPAEAYQGYKKFNDIEEILDFVEGPHTSSKFDGKSAPKRKQERSRKKEHQLNGPLTLEDTLGGEDGSDSMETVAVVIKPGLEAMGNSSGKSLGENSISKTEPTEDSFDKNSEFHDCLNTLPTEPVIISDRAPQHQQNDSIKRTSISEVANKNDLCLKGHNIIENNLTDNEKIASKKSTKTKIKREANHDNGPLSGKAKMVKPKESSEIKDSLLLKSLSPSNNRNSHYSNDAEQSLEIKREDSFTEVKKRKKRFGVKEPNTASTNHSSLNYHSHNINRHPHRSNPRSHPFTPPPSHAATGVATVGSTVNYLPVNGETHLSRDLSPSAFPVLSGLCPVAPHTDNRRNSCGDLNTDSIDNKIYDSDRESAKSLPDGCGTRVGGDLSPLYPVSYARIAAAPRRSDNTNSPSSESGVTSGSQISSINSSVTHTPGSSIDIMSPHPQSPSTTTVMPERKATVWKGSPRERRHSIGSSPDDKEEREKTSVAQCHRQCGSQEVLSRDNALVKVSSNDVTSAPSSLPVLPNSESFDSFQSDTDQQEGTLHDVLKNVSNQPKNTVNSSQTGTKAPSQKLSIPSSEYATSNSAICHPQSGRTVSISSKLKEKVGIELSASNVAVSDVSEAKKGISSHPVTATTLPAMIIPAGDNNVKTVNKKVVATQRITPKMNGGTNNTKSVIFLDKRFGASSPQNLGITFGFDLSYEPVCEPASQTASQQHQPSLSSQPQLVSVVLSSSSSHNCSADSSTQAQCFPTAHPHIPSAAESAIASSKQPVNPSSQSSTTSDPVPKVPYIRNGLILPSSAAEIKDSMQAPVTNSSISINNDNNNTNLPSSNRTSPSSTISTVLVNHSINSQLIPGPLIKSVIPNSSPVELEDISLSQGSQSLSTSIPQANPTEVTFSPNHPPPPLPQGTVTITEDKNLDTNNSTSALPSAQNRQESNPENLSVPESTNDWSTSSPVPSTAEGEAIELSSATTITSELPATTTDVGSQKQHCPSVPTDVLHIVYGEKIKPVTGCGRLIFVPYISQSNGNSKEIASFLRKKWFKDVAMKKGSYAFVTLDDD